MGTETKFNYYTKNGSSTDGGACIAKGSTSVLVSNTAINQNGHTNGGSVNVNGKEALNGCNKTNGTNGTTPTKQTSPTAEVPSVPIYIDENDVVSGAKDLLKIIRPNWNLNEVQFKKFTDGITNKLVGCFNAQTDIKNGASKTTNGHSNNGVSKSKTNGHGHYVDDNEDSGNLSDSDTDTDSTNSIKEPCSSNVVLVRVYGNKTDLLIDRRAETRNILLLHKYGFAPPLYATFKNGLAYDYVPGVTLNTASVLRPEVWNLVARRMAEMHRTINAGGGGGGGSVSREPIVSMLWKKTQSFLDLVPERFSDPAKHKRIEGTFLPIARMRDEFAFLYRRLEALGSPLVFAHNDLLLGNVIYNESLQKVNFIDYEYADYNFQAFDIGNHFAEFAGVDEVDYTRYPGREFQYEWLRVYLQVYLNRAQVSDDEVHRLYVQVNQFSLASHFFWILWSLIQAEHSKIDFDYVDYACTRYKEYLTRKDEFLALDLNGSS